MKQRYKMEAEKLLGFGLMRLPYSPDESNGHIDIEKTREMIDAFMTQGFSYFDTAWVYHGGFSETVFGELVAKRYPREKFQVTTKMPLWSMKDPSELQKIFDKQLEKCQVKYFDNYYLHALNKDMAAKADELGAFDFIKKMKEEGKIHRIGFSFHDTADVLDDILTKHLETELVQLQINYIDWESDGVQSRKCYEVAMKHGVKVAIMEPIKGGSLANMMDDAKKIFTDYNPKASLASWAVRFAASLDNLVTVLSGMSNMEQLEDNMSYMKDFVPLNADEKKCVEKATELIKNTIAIPCTACRYCVDGCPKKINIPRYFELFNEQKRYGLNSFKWHYNETKKNGGAPADCINCRKCEQHCPQKIVISEQLKVVKDTFEA